MSPVYWKLLESVPVFEILMHRIVWSFFFLIPLLILQSKWREFRATVKNPRTLLILLSTTVFIAGNWFTFIWAINHGLILQASLGYYVNPLVNVFLGMIFLRERLRPLQLVSLILAGSGVLFLTLWVGEFPWVGLVLAFSFGFYGLIRKVAPVGPLVGLSVETLILSVPALAYLFYLGITGTGVFFRMGVRTDVLLMISALVTGLPLLLFNEGAKRLHLSTVGFLQYISPSCIFVLGVFVYDEAISHAQIAAFVLIWTALLVYSADSAFEYRRHVRLASVPR